MANLDPLRLFQARPRASLLFVARRADALELAARRAACALLGDDRPLRKRHPDYHEFDALQAGPGGTDAARAWLANTERKPFEGGKVVMVALNADRLEPGGANALLKTVEEPPENTALILTATNTARLLPTILSRVFRVPIPASELETPGDLLTGQRFLQLVRATGPTALQDLLRLGPELRRHVELALPMADDVLTLATLLEHLRLLDTYVAPDAVALALRRKLGPQGTAPAT